MRVISDESNVKYKGKLYPPGEAFDVAGPDEAEFREKAKRDPTIRIVKDKKSKADPDPVPDAPSKPDPNAADPGAESAGDDTESGESDGESSDNGDSGDASNESDKESSDESDKEPKRISLFKRKGSGKS